MKNRAAAPKNQTIVPDPRRAALMAGAASIAVACVLIAAKSAAAWYSGSASVAASLADSVADALMSVTNFMAIRYALKPADHEHRFGHGKIEGLAALLQAALIAGAGILLLRESAHRFLDPHPVENLALAAGVMVFSIVLSAALVAVQSASLKKAPSLAVESDRAHYATDIAINGGVLAVMGILYAGGPAWADPAFAATVAVYLAFTAYGIARQGLDMLLDRELPAHERQAITARVESDPDVIGIHDLRTYRSGMRTFISFDVELDPDLTLREAHDIVRKVENTLLADFPHAEIMIHADPRGDTDDSRHHVEGVHR